MIRLAMIPTDEPEGLALRADKNSRQPRIALIEREGIEVVVSTNSVRSLCPSVQTMATRCGIYSFALAAVPAILHLWCDRPRLENRLGLGIGMALADK